MPTALLGKWEKGNMSNYDLLDESLGQICLELASPEAEKQSPGKIKLSV